MDKITETDPYRPTEWLEAKLGPVLAVLFLVVFLVVI